MNKKIIIGVALVAIIAVIALATFVNSHEGKTVNANASDLMPSINSFPSGSNWEFQDISSSGATYTDTDGVVSYAQGTYVERIMSFSYTSTIKIYVFDTTENAKNAYNTTKASFSGTNISNYGPFDQGFRYGDVLGYKYVFQEMNVYMEINFGSILLGSETDKILSDIEKKIHNAAK